MTPRPDALRVSLFAYRNPALLAKMVTTLDVISGGRLIWGIGAGWYQHEFTGYGYEFPKPADRIRLLRETVEIVRGAVPQPSIGEAYMIKPGIGYMAMRGGFNQTTFNEFLAAMKQLGYREGRDYTFDFREWKQPAEIPLIARDLVKLNAAVIVASAPPSILGVRSATDRRRMTPPRIATDSIA